MIYDFFVFGNGVNKATKIDSTGTVDDAADAAKEYIENETGTICNTVIHVPGNRTLNELAKLEEREILLLGKAIQIFYYEV